MGAAILVTAYLLGLVASRIGLPPLVGYLTAGFALHLLGETSTVSIEAVAEAGILVLLFSIGLKVRLATLRRSRLWGTAATHAAAFTAFLAGILAVAVAVGLPLVDDLPGEGILTLGFALAFSSTVSAIKTLDARGEADSLTGRLTMGILVIQDLLAVAYLAIAVDQSPGWKAAAIVSAIVALRPLYGWALERSGHDELLTLFGVTMALGVGGAGFGLAGLKPDLGALVVGILLAHHRRAPELADRLLSLKDLLLVAFFVSIGLAGAPPPAAWAIAAGILMLLPLKAAGFLALLLIFRLRGRTSLNAALLLATYSEFGLIVVAAARDQGRLDDVWVAAMAIVVAVSFVVAAAANRWRHAIFRSTSSFLGRVERSAIDVDDAVVDYGEARIIVFGMGRVGEGVYDEIVRRRGEVVVGVERDTELVAHHRAAGRNVIRGDALDRELWEKIAEHDSVDLIVLGLNRHAANLECVSRVAEFRPGTPIAAIATFPDQVAELRAAGVGVSRNLYEEAGQGLASDVMDQQDARRGEQR